MRRKEFAVQDMQEIESFLAEMSFGFLGTVGADGLPHIKPLNFVYSRDAIYFHGSRIGQKIEDVKLGSKVTFCVAQEYALIPSYFTDPTFACPATAFFKSVTVTGTASIVDDMQEKAEALAAFMRKLQPEGGYAPIDPDNAEYVSRIRGVAVVRIDIEELSGKFKFGQNMKSGPFESVVEGLTERGYPMDAETVELMKKYCPAHRE